VQTLKYLKISYAADWLAFRERLLQKPGVQQALKRERARNYKTTVDDMEKYKPTVDDIEETHFLPSESQHSVIQSPNIQKTF
jgi:hypothetical protein